MDERRLSTMFRGDSERQLALSYRGGPLAPLDGEHTGTMQAGDRAPDGQCAGPGSERLFDAYRGPHFTLLAFGPRATRTLDRVAWPEHGAPLKRLTVADDRTAKTYGIDRDTLVLVRPDGYLAGVFADDDPAAAFGSVAGQLTPAGERALSRSR
jgi:hypothetical protein